MKYLFYILGPDLDANMAGALKNNKWAKKINNTQK